MLISLVGRLIGAGALGVAGWQLGELVSGATADQAEYVPWGLGFTLGGVLLGAMALPYVLYKPLGLFLDRLNQVPVATLLASTIGLVTGLVVAVLISIPLFNLGGWLAWGVPIMVSLALGALGLWIGVHRDSDLSRILPWDSGDASMGSAPDGRIVVDTSAIIDGRIVDLGQTGFLRGTLVIPGFVLNELRHIADSSDSLRRARGRRGLEVLGKLRKDGRVSIQVLDMDLVNGAEVDGELVKLAKVMKAPILTTDFNLNRVAEVQGIRVLNVNELSNALRPMVLPGEELTVNIIQEGREVGQGVAFLDDGTMVVVEAGRRYLNTLQDVTVTRVLQTAAGRIIFAHPKAGQYMPTAPPQRAGHG